ncbi:hypothetical protein DKX38_003592 [Salix brachista]|uniref:Stomagen C-terminal domain-containing protein n=1 Tax=Salix brachista TaxID=2182728 RepID=A0A5N5NRD3_9ROSI|nr:hypothetical protein DKX38_003592 [Salix brachista]
MVLQYDAVLFKWCGSSTVHAWLERTRFLGLETPDPSIGREEWRTLSYATYSPFSSPSLLQRLLFKLIDTTIHLCIAGSRNQELLTYHQSISTPSSQEDSHALGGNEEQMSSKRLMIGSTAPTCTYNECRGCKYKCRAEQVPVEGNDPINSAYHYKCICHR